MCLCIFLDNLKEKLDRSIIKNTPWLRFPAIFGNGYKEWIDGLEIFWSCRFKNHIFSIWKFWRTYKSFLVCKQFFHRNFLTILVIMCRFIFWIVIADKILCFESISFRWFQTSIFYTFQILDQKYFKSSTFQKLCFCLVSILWNLDQFKCLFFYRFFHCHIPMHDCNILSFITNFHWIGSFIQKIALSRWDFFYIIISQIQIRKINFSIFDHALRNQIIFFMDVFWLPIRMFDILCCIEPVNCTI